MNNLENMKMFFFLTICLLQQIPNVSPTGRFTTLIPFIMILTLSALKEIFEDIKRHRADRGVNRSKAKVLNKITRKFEIKTWEQVQVGDIVKCSNGEFFPSDLLLISSSEPNGMCYIETANLDGETNLKIRQSLNATYKCLNCDLLVQNLDLCHVEYDLPNSHLYEFKGVLKLENKFHQINPDQILLRGAKLKNTAWTYGMVLYTGHETKLMLNSMLKTPSKQSNIEKLTNSLMVYLFCILIIIALISTICSQAWNSMHKPWYLDRFNDFSSNSGYVFLTFIILYNNLIPISMQMTLEVVRFIQAQFINWDLEMYCPETDSSAVARTSNLNEELGQVSYIFSDKTGTLTRNVMEFRQCSIAGTIYNESEYQNIIKLIDSNQAASKYAKEFMTLMAVCHTVIPEKKNNSVDETDDRGFHDESDDITALNHDFHTEKTEEFSENLNGKFEEIIYQASSPDEAALVKGAKSIGYVFTARTPKFVFINANGKDEKYEILNVVEFTSDRKRMSVVVKCPDNSIKVYVKGADSVIYERLSENKFADKTLEHLEYFATFGLRTLCLAFNTLSEDFYKKWTIEFQAALTSDINIREQKINETIEKLEKNLILLGCTAIEDKLQEGVPEAIDTLQKARIRIWVLTGDKQETAINIGHSCKLLKTGTPIHVINEDSVDGFLRVVQKYLMINDNSQASLVIDGSSLKHALEERSKTLFLKLALECKSVICCRVSPMQKADIVNLVKLNKPQSGDKRSIITLAIGDGANDVAMIRAAHVGIGISGNEGLQAAHSADYSISQFRFLVRLLLVHGSWSLSRLCKLILYSFYKNIALYVIEFWFAMLSAWSGQTIFDRWTIGLYNVLFTMAPPLAIGLFERQCSAETMIKNPELYSQHSNSFTNSVFWFWTLGAILHSLCLFWLTYLAVMNDVIWANGLSDGGWLVFGNILYTYVVITVCLKAGLESNSWTYITHLTIWGSISFWVLFLIVYSNLWPVIPISPDMSGIHNLIFSSAVFWMGLFIIPFITLLPDFVYKVVMKTCYKTFADILIENEVKSRSQKNLLSETAKLIRNFCDANNRKINNLSEEEISNENAPRLAFKKNAIDSNMDLESKEAEFELQYGFAFSQEEHGAVSQSQLIRSYDTTK